MTIAFDAFSKTGGSATVGNTATGATTWTHTPVGTPIGVVVMITQGLANTDQVTAVSYGGVAMTRLDFVSEAGGGDPTNCYSYVLTSGVPSGAQTVSVTTNAANNWNAVATTVTGTTASSVTVDSHNANIGTTANATLSNTFSTTLADYVTVLGYCDATNTVAGASVNTGTTDTNADIGSQCGYFVHIHGTSASSQTFATTSSNASWAYAAVNLIEAASATPASTKLISQSAALKRASTW